MSFRNPTKESVLKSNLALKIVCYLAVSKDRYPTAMSKELGVHVGVLNDYIRALEKFGLIKKGRRTKAQEYELSKGLTLIWKDLWLRYFNKQLIDKPIFDSTDVVKFSKDDLTKTKKAINHITEDDQFLQFLNYLLNPRRGDFNTLNDDPDRNIESVLTDGFQKALGYFFETSPDSKMKFRDKNSERLYQNLKELNLAILICDSSQHQMLVAKWWEGIFTE